MKAIGTFLLACAISCQGLGQLLNAHDFDTVSPKKHSIYFSGVIDYSSSAIRNEMLSPLIFGGEIGSFEKDRSLNNQQPFNVLGGEGGGTAAYYFTHKSERPFLKPYLMGIKYANHYVGSMRYASDLYKFTFYGNQEFLGAYATFSGSEAHLINFQTLGFSLLHKESRSSLTLNLVGVNHYTNAYMNDMKFYYSEQGDSIYGICNGGVNTANSPAYFKGLGFSLDGDYRFNILSEESGKSMKMQFSVSNLGMAYISSYKNQALDTSFAFGGFTISDLINQEGLLAPGFSYVDSLTVSSVKGRWVPLPASVQLFSLVDVTSKKLIQPSYGLRLLFTTGYIPYFYAGIATRIFPKMHLTTCASYGGFSGFKLNTAFSFHWAQCYLGIASENTLGLFSKSAFGKSLSIRLRCDI